MSGERRNFGAVRKDGVRHAVYNSSVAPRFGNALCDYSLNVAFCEPLQPGQKVCQRPTCKRLAEEDPAFKDKPDNRGTG